MLRLVKRWLVKFYYCWIIWALLELVVMWKVGNITNRKLSDGTDRLDKMADDMYPESWTHIYELG